MISISRQLIFIYSKRILAAAVLLAILVITLHVIGVLGNLECLQVGRRVAEVNILSGRTRDSTYIFCFQVREIVSDNTVSNLVQKTSGDDLYWRRSTTSVPFGGPSPHHYYHGGITQLSSMESILEIGNYTNHEQKEIAIGLLDIWQKKGDASSAWAYLDNVREDMMDSIIKSKSRE